MAAGTGPGASTGAATPVAGDQWTDFGAPGPFEVAHTTLSLDGDSVEVFLPAAEVDGVPWGYEIAADVPAAVLGQLPPALVGRIEVTALADGPPSPEGPFPVVINSPGVATDRRWMSRHLAHLASWGFVAAAPDQTHLGLVAATTGIGRDAPAGADVEQLEATLDLLTRATIERGNPLEGVMDTERVGVEGLDAGGAAALAFGRDPQVDVVIGLAPGAPVPFGPVADDRPLADRLDAVAAPDVPVMVIAAAGDDVIDTGTVIDPIVDWLGGGATLAVLAGTGHSVFLDLCQTLWTAGGLRPATTAGTVPIDARLLALRNDGCDPTDDVEPRTLWPVIDHLTVAQYRSVLGPDQEAARRSLAPDVLAEAFPALLADPGAG